MVPEKELVRREFMIRDMRLPSDTKLTKASLLRWICLSLGLLSPDESRQSILPIFDAFLTLQFSGINPSVTELADKSKQPEKAVRYHLKRLIAIGLIEEQKRRYRFIQDSSSNSLNLSKSFREHYAESLTASLSSVEEAMAELQRSYRA